MVRHFSGRLKTQDLHYCDEGKIPVSGSRDADPKIRGWWHLCSAELGLPDYRSGISRRLGREVVKTLQSAEETLP